MSVHVKIQNEEQPFFQISIKTFDFKNQDLRLIVGILLGFAVKIFIACLLFCFIKFGIGCDQYHAAFWPSVLLGSFCPVKVY